MKIKIDRHAWLCLLGGLFCSYARPALTPVAADITTAHVAPAPSAETDPPVPAINDDPFPAPPELRPAVAFWENVFAVWERDQVVLHDREHLGIVYELMDLPGTDNGRLTAEQEREIRWRVGKLERTLSDLEYRIKRRLSLTREHRHLLHTIVRGAGKTALRGAGERVRVQRGMRASFLLGLKASGHHEQAFRQVFREAGLPEDLAYLPHVESAFTARARSSAGAVGVWQFVPETGRRFLRINNAVDERYDPILATRGAARYLAYAYAKLGDWGLAITAYNHGLSGMLRAKQQCGADMTRIIREYDAPTFGFASSQYYAEFLAVREIVTNLSAFFPEGVNRNPPVEKKGVRFSRAVTVADLTRAYGLKRQTLVDLNPGWTTAAAEGRVALPAETEFWLPGNAVAQSEQYTQFQASVISE